jgi:hypothetical protein
MTNWYGIDQKSSEVGVKNFYKLLIKLGFACALSLLSLNFSNHVDYLRAIKMLTFWSTQNFVPYKRL